MLIGEDKHEMAAFTPDQERAVVFHAGWALSAVSRRLLRTSRVKETVRPEFSILLAAAEVGRIEKGVSRSLSIPQSLPPA